ncbi:MAG: threonine/serine dehydratase, partial [Asgard group archaeon]|nr:threonine/serine dehydratase [Asgard group archaeon]
MVDLNDIIMARSLIQDNIIETPLVTSQYLSDLCNAQVYLKLENQQITHSFKIRGASNRILQLTPEEKDHGIITASSGNHGLAVAMLADKLEIPARIIVPKTTPEVKIKKLSNYNVDLELHGENYDEAEIFARKISEEEQLTFISAYNDPMIIAGQGTIGLEISEQLPNVTDIFVPLGGGGLLSGIAIAIKSLNPTVNLIGVQTEACPAFYYSLKANKIVDVEMRESIADGMYGGIEQGSITFDIIREFVDDVKVVSELTIKRAISLLWKEDHQLTEGAAAAAIVPLLDQPL